MEENEVVILLATYNGEKYINVLIDSIIDQTYKSWKLVLSDDGSSDGTVDILKDYAMHYPNKIVCHHSGIRFGSASKHFMHLLREYQNASYIMFCDQDDYWYSDKIEKTIQKMQDIEKNQRFPAMVHTDLRVVDKDLNCIDNSFMHFSSIHAESMTLQRRLVQNVVTGCTVMVNSSLARHVCNHIPQKGMIMHDWWIAIVAEAIGEVGYIDEPTIDYRQHQNNQVGAKSLRSSEYVMMKIKNNKFKKAMSGTYIQAQAILECFGCVLDETNRMIVQEYADNIGRRWMGRRVSWIKGGYYKCGIMRVIAQFLLC